MIRKLAHRVILTRKIQKKFVYSKYFFNYRILNIQLSHYSSVREIASRILHEICLLIGELAIRGTKLTLNAR